MGLRLYFFQIFHGLRLFKDVRLFQTLEYILYIFKVEIFLQKYAV